MLRSIKKGISTIEVILVLAISVSLLAIVIGAFNFRKRTEADDAARQVMSEIAKIRNEAQQGLGPTTPAGVTRIQGGGPNELFGAAIEFIEDCGGNQSCMRVYKLMQGPSPGNLIMPFEMETKNLPGRLRWFVPANGPACSSFTSCYQKTTSNPIDVLSASPVDLNNNKNLMLVIRNNTGESFVKSRPRGIISIYDPNFMGAQANNVSDYTPEFQGKLRIAFAQINSTSGSFANQISNAPYQYYAHFELSVPNNQSLEVVK